MFTLYIEKCKSQRTFTIFYTIFTLFMKQITFRSKTLLFPSHLRVAHR